MPSAVIVDERGKVSGLTFTITNQTKKEQGFAIDKIHIKEVVKPGEDQDHQGGRNGFGCGRHRPERVPVL